MMISYRWQIAKKAASNSIYRRTTESVGGVFWKREVPGHSDRRESCGRTQHGGGQNSGKMVLIDSICIDNLKFTSLLSFTTRKNKTLIDSAWIWCCCLAKASSPRSLHFIIFWCFFRNSLCAHIFGHVAYRWKVFFIIESFIPRLWEEAQS